MAASKVSSDFVIYPPVSITVNCLSVQIDFPYFLSRVVPLVGSVIASLVSVNRLNIVDLPTFGLPTIATKKSIVQI